jgi:hypothetical protein
VTAALLPCLGINPRVFLGDDPLSALNLIAGIFFMLFQYDISRLLVKYLLRNRNCRKNIRFPRNVFGKAAFGYSLAKD